MLFVCRLICSETNHSGSSPCSTTVSRWEKSALRRPHHVWSAVSSESVRAETLSSRTKNSVSHQGTNRCAISSGKEGKVVNIGLSQPFMWMSFPFTDAGGGNYIWWTDRFFKPFRFTFQSKYQSSWATLIQLKKLFTLKTTSTSIAPCPWIFRSRTPSQSPNQFHSKSLRWVLPWIYGFSEIMFAESIVNEVETAYAQWAVCCNVHVQVHVHKNSIFGTKIWLGTFPKNSAFAVLDRSFI